MMMVYSQFKYLFYIQLVLNQDKRLQKNNK